MMSKEVKAVGVDICRRASYASDPGSSRGRVHDQASSSVRTEFQRDRDRIIHAVAFRRLKQKTQVFVAHEGDHYRTRLTHSLEVSQIARSVSRALGLDEDLSEALALSHDIGHPPFGHTGEEVLSDCMSGHGGFDHNAQSLRVVTELERVYPLFDGLNLSWETLEGLVKHNGPLLGSCGGSREVSDLAEAYRLYAHIEDLELFSHAGLEAQVTALADDIAYNNHDLDDGLSAGLFKEEELLELPLVGETFEEVRREYPCIGTERVRSEAVRRLIGIWVMDLIKETSFRIKEAAVDSVEGVRGIGYPLASFSEDHKKKQKKLREFFVDRMYQHERINEMRNRAKRIIRDLFSLFMEEPHRLPLEWQERVDRDSARAVCDYIAGMTDVFAIAEYRRLLEGCE